MAIEVDKLRRGAPCLRGDGPRSPSAAGAVLREARHALVARLYAPYAPVWPSGHQTPPRPRPASRASVCTQLVLGPYIFHVDLETELLDCRLRRPASRASVALIRCTHSDQDSDAGPLN